jgi:cellulose synthase/poly-beta-1,6-N-acetylglucosamine synthase-like glycosyltransferase
MTITLVILFWISGFAIFYAMIGYPLVLIFLDKLFKPKEHDHDYSYMPSVTIMVVAHNEEKVIQEKLKNVSALDYPSDKLEILVASDNSTDATNEIVKTFIQANPEKRIRLFEVKERKGKTNAQNEAQKTVDSEVLVMTDANAMLKENAIKELVSMFTDPSIVYVTGRLSYVNSLDNLTSYAESSYWNIDLKMRDIESRFQTITAGNGALYAVRNSEYIDFDPIRCHDSAMPQYYGLQKKKALFCPTAIAYEKAGENDGDEFKRKIRMARGILRSVFPNPVMLNIFRLKWFSFFYLGHRVVRSALFLSHIVVFLTSLFLALNGHPFFFTVLVMQIVFYFFAILPKVGIKNKLIKFISYYCMTILAQAIGAYNMITGKSKPFWEKAESTR